MSTVLVTGGAGYIGAHTCKALAAAGHVPVVYDNLIYGHREAVRWGPFEAGDIQDRTRLDQVIATHAPTALIHFAAYAYVGESMTDPGKYYRNNAAGSLNLLETIRDHGIRHMVFSSTCATYGVPDVIPIVEDAPQRPINAYGQSKLMVEQMMADFERAHGLAWIALRYFNAAGADPDGEAGEDHDPETHLIPLILDAASGRRSAITVFGTDYDTPDGSCIRDYVHVTDLADAHVRALGGLERGLPSGPFNLGNGTGYSVSEVIAAVERVTGLKVPVEYGPRRVGDPARLVGSAARAHEILGWRPQFADLDDIIRTAWAWHQRANVT
ncbi:MAG: UDP-glucose 4-epimerase GalE [Minwuia sp.]|nr:UDP-glucose 4-epimerase GalE [Minwuia sp.]